MVEENGDNCLDAIMPAIEQLFQNTATSPVWIVGEGEKSDYMRNGATTVHEGGKLCDRR